MSKVMEDLTQVPAIVASLGLAIAEAQKQFDVNYLNGVQALAAMAQAFGAGNAPISIDLLNHLLSTAAPPRYQFTETTLDVKLDLAQSRDLAAQAGLGFGFAGVVVNAAFAMSSSESFRASAEVKTVIHAVLPQDNKTVFDTLIGQLKNLTPVPLPDKAAMNDKVLDAMKGAAASIGATTGKDAGGKDLPAHPA